MNNAEFSQNIADFLQTLARFGVRLDLTTSRRLLETLGNPQQQVPILHVAGSNGKGSVCAYLSSILKAAGYKVGRYTSPHLVDWNERICLQDQPIPPSELHAVLMQVKAKIAQISEANRSADRPETEPIIVTQFEAITAAMWLYFAQQQVDVAVIEVGLGGRLDATNVVDKPLVSVITSISREHWQRLGSTLGQIAAEKAGILKAGCPAIVGSLPSEAQSVLAQRIADLQCPVMYPTAAQSLGQGWAEYAGSLRYRLPLAGAIQLENSALAIGAIQALQNQGWLISDQAISQGIAQTQWPGRLQSYQWRGRDILIDGAHNAAGATLLRQHVDSLGIQPIHWVMGMVATKDHREVLRLLLHPGDSLSLLAVPGTKSAVPEDLADLAAEVCPDLADRTIYPNVAAALEVATAQPGLTVLCGSLYLIGHFFQTEGMGTPN